MATKIRIIAYCGAVAALYVVLTLALAPISYGPIQLRVSELLKPLALFAPWFAVAFAVGTCVANLFSPFGLWDYAAMPVVDALAAWVCWKLRRWPVLALVTQAAIIAVGVAVFPLGLGGRLPFWSTFPGVLISQIVLLLAGWFIIWRPREDMLQWHIRR